MIGIPDNPVGHKLISTLLPALVLWCATLAAPAADPTGFCERLPRPADAAFEKHAASNDWFEVHEVAPGIFETYALICMEADVKTVAATIDAFSALIEKFNSTK